MQRQVLEALALQMRRLERGPQGSLATARPASAQPESVQPESIRREPPSPEERGRFRPVRTLGIEPLDQLLVEGGVPEGSLIEWLDFGAGSGVATVALWGAARARRSEELLVVVDSRGDFYPPASIPLGLDWRTVVVRPPRGAEALWTVEQALRTPGVGVVVGTWERWSRLAGRRLQLAAEQGGSLGFLLRPARDRREPSFAEVRWEVTPLPSVRDSARRWRLELARARRQPAGACVELELCDETDRLHLVAAMAAATPRAAAAGA